MYSSGTIAWADPQRKRLTSPCVKSSHPLDQRYSAELSLVVAVVHATKHHHTALLLVSVERNEDGILRGQQQQHCLRVVLVHPSRP